MLGVEKIGLTFKSTENVQEYFSGVCNKFMDTPQEVDSEIFF